MNINLPRFFFAALAAFVVIFGLEYLTHSKVFIGTYNATSELWRSHGSMDSFMSWLVLAYGIIAFGLTFLYAAMGKGKRWSCGLCLGAIIGAIYGASSFVSYAVMPIPLELAVGWFFNYVVIIACAGAVVAMIYPGAKGEGCCDQLKEQ